MTNDIVTRLRATACPECGLPSTHNLFDEAADEIERLRELANEEDKNIALQARAIRRRDDEIERLRQECFKWEQNAKKFANRLDQALVDGEISELGL